MAYLADQLIRERQPSVAFLHDPDLDERPGTRRLRAAFCLSCTAVYFLVGVWLISDTGFLIGDAAYRTANARTILFSRDPHLAAIGMVWMPLSTLSTLPFSALFEPFGMAWAAGAAMSAGFGGGFAWAMTRIASHICPRSVIAQMVVAVTLLNPVVVFWMGSGMMEAPSLFFLAWAILSWLRWTESDDPRHLGLLGTALGLGFFTRYEQLFVAVVFVLLVVWFEARGSRRNAALLVAAPTVFVGLVWLAVNYVIKGDPLAFIPNVNAERALLPVEMQIEGQRTLGLGQALGYGAKRILRFAPAAIFTVPLAAVEIRMGRWRPVLVGTGLAALASPVFVALLTMSEGKTTGNPRYFLSAIVIGPIFLLGALSGRLIGARWWTLILGVSAMFGLITSVQMELSQFYAGIEHEEVAVSKLTGLAAVPLPGTQLESGTLPGLIGPWREAAREVDDAVDSDGWIAADSSSAFLLLLFTDRLEQFAIPEDRDFEQLLSVGGERFDYIFVRRGEITSQTGINDKLVSIVETTSDGARFTKIGDYEGIGELWKRVDEAR